MPTISIVCSITSTPATLFVHKLIIDRIGVIAIKVIEPSNIDPAHRIIPAIGKHVIAQESLAGGDEGIGVDESAPGGIVIAALEIVQP